MKQCWSVERADRPTFTTIQETLQDLSTSEDLSHHVLLNNIDPQSPYYKTRHHQDSNERTDEEAERGMVCSTMCKNYW